VLLKRELCSARRDFWSFGLEGCVAYTSWDYLTSWRKPFSPWSVLCSANGEESRFIFGLFSRIAANNVLWAFRSRDTAIRSSRFTLQMGVFGRVLDSRTNKVKTSAKLYMYLGQREAWDTLFTYSKQAHSPWSSWSSHKFHRPASVTKWPSELALIFQVLQSPCEVSCWPSDRHARVAVNGKGVQHTQALRYCPFLVPPPWLWLWRHRGDETGPVNKGVNMCHVGPPSFAAPRLSNKLQSSKISWLGMRPANKDNLWRKHGKKKMKRSSMNECL